MKVNKITQTQKIVKKMQQLKQEMTMSTLLGDCEGFKNAKIEYAKEAVNNYELSKTVKGGGASAPLFSKYGWNILKVMIYNAFRKKSPEEKMLNKMYKKDTILMNKNIDIKT